MRALLVYHLTGNLQFAIWKMSYIFRNYAACNLDRIAYYEGQYKMTLRDKCKNLPFQMQCSNYLSHSLTRVRYKFVPGIFQKYSQKHVEE